MFLFAIKTLNSPATAFALFLYEQVCALISKKEKYSSGCVQRWKPGRLSRSRLCSSRGVSRESREGAVSFARPRAACRCFSPGPHSRTWLPHPPQTSCGILTEARAGVCCFFFFFSGFLQFLFLHTNMRGKKGLGRGGTGRKCLEKIIWHTYNIINITSKNI